MHPCVSLRHLSFFTSLCPLTYFQYLGLDRVLCDELKHSDSLSLTHLTHQRKFWTPRSPCGLGRLPELRWPTATKDRTNVSDTSHLRLTRKTFEAAVRFKPTAPDLREISITRGLLSVFFGVTGVWKEAMTCSRCMFASVTSTGTRSPACQTLTHRTGKTRFLRPAKWQQCDPRSS